MTGAAPHDQTTRFVATLPNSREIRRSGGTTRRGTRGGRKHPQRTRRQGPQTQPTSTNVPPAEVNTHAKNLPQASEILNHMAKHETAAKSLQWGCHALSDLAANHAENQHEIGSLGGVEIVVKAMVGFPEEMNLQGAGMGALERTTSGHTNNTLRLVASDGIRCIVRSMTAFNQMQRMQEFGCKILCNTTACNAECQIKVAKDGGVNAVLNAMRLHLSAASVQELGCRSLKELAAYNASNQENIASQGGIQVVLRAMENHTSLPDVQEVACGVLRNLAACNAEYRCVSWSAEVCNWCSKQ